jgi:hypothetical protein
LRIARSGARTRRVFIPRDAFAMPRPWIQSGRHGNDDTLDVLMKMVVIRTWKVHHSVRPAVAQRFQFLD